MMGICLLIHLLLTGLRLVKVFNWCVKQCTIRSVYFYSGHLNIKVVYRTNLIIQTGWFSVWRNPADCRHWLSCWIYLLIWEVIIFILRDCKDDFFAVYIYIFNKLLSYLCFHVNSIQLANYLKLHQNKNAIDHCNELTVEMQKWQIHLKKKKDHNYELLSSHLWMYFNRVIARLILTYLKHWQNCYKDPLNFFASYVSS